MLIIRQSDGSCFVSSFIRNETKDFASSSYRYQRIICLQQPLARSVFIRCCPKLLYLQAILRDLLNDSSPVVVLANCIYSGCRDAEFLLSPRCSPVLFWNENAGVRVDSRSEKHMGNLTPLDNGIKNQCVSVGLEPRSTDSPRPQADHSAAASPPLVA